jgi:hypothetical protein
LNYLCGFDYCVKLSGDEEAVISLGAIKGNGF